jgi:transposase
VTAGEEIAQLKKELAALRAKSARLEGELARERAANAHLRQMLEEVLRRLGEGEGQLAKNSHKSSKPPSSDGLGRKRASMRKKGEKQPDIWR